MAAALQFDQRGVGFPRIVNGTVDMGAVEGALDITCPAFPVTVFTETELYTAITCYNYTTTPGVYTITLGADINLTNVSAPVDNATAGVSLVIEGDNYTIDAQDTAGVRPLTVLADTTVTLNDATLTGGAIQGTQDGGGLYNDGTMVLNRVIITGNHVVDDGGGIRNDDNGTMTIVDSTINGNQAGNNDGSGVGDGGGISNRGTMSISGSTVSNNTAIDDQGVNGGGIYSQGSLTIDTTTIDGNAAVALNPDSDAYGGGIYSESQLTITNSTISNNTVTS